MAILVFTNAYVLVNGVDLTDHCTKVTTIDDRAEVDVTVFGTGFVQLTKGLGTAEIDLEFIQDYAAAKVHATLQPLVGSTTAVAVEVRPVNAARSATNPAMLMSTALLFSYHALDGQPGDADKVQAAFKNGPGGAGMTYPTA